MLDAWFELHQGGIIVAQSRGDRPDALREILHYAAVYGQDGPVEAYERLAISGRKRVRVEALPTPTKQEPHHEG